MVRRLRGSGVVHLAAQHIDRQGRHEGNFDVGEASLAARHTGIPVQRERLSRSRNRVVRNFSLQPGWSDFTSGSRTDAKALARPLRQRRSMQSPRRHGPRQRAPEPGEWVESDRSGRCLEKPRSGPAEAAPATQMVSNLPDVS